MSDCFLGEIRLFAGNYNPENWVMCNGQTLDLNQYQALYSLIGVTYGGNGVTTFNIPDLRGRLPIGQGQGTGLTNRVLAQTGGEENHTIVEAEMTAHTHPVYATASLATSQTAAPTMVYGQVTPTAAQYGLYNATLPPTTTLTQFDTRAVGYSGGSQPHGNVMTTTAISFIMAMLGNYPTRPN